MQSFWNSDFVKLLPLLYLLHMSSEIQLMASLTADYSTPQVYKPQSVLQVTATHNDECKRLLQLMGVPVITAPSEAEAQCAVMAKSGLVYGVATEDMDSLTFGAPRLIRHLMAPGSQNVPIQEFDRDMMLQVGWFIHSQPMLQRQVLAS